MGKDLVRDVADQQGLPGDQAKPPFATMQSVPGLLYAVAAGVGTRSMRELEWNLRSLHEQMQAFPDDVGMHMKSAGSRDDFFAAIVAILDPQQLFDRAVQDVALVLLAAAGKDVAMTLDSSHPCF